MAAGSGSWGGFDHHGIFGDHFMEYLDLIDFPMESLEGGGGLDQGDWDARVQAIGTILVEAKPLLGSPLASVGDNGNATSNVVPINNDNATSNVVPSNNDNTTSNVVPSLSVHTEVSSEVKPPINFTKEASEASIPVQNDPSHVSESGVFQSSSPVSLPESLQSPSPVSLPESTSSCSGEKSMSTSSENVVLAPTTHTKHSESSTIDPQLGMPPISCTGKRQPRKRKLSQPSGAFPNSKTTTQNSSQWPAAAGKKCSVASSSSAPSQNKKYTKKCLHCGAGKTPQWRGGPMGPKTLCNACGVRYRTGRLLPEYRPVASPSFVQSLHSNCHRKVIQMRKKAARESSSTVETETPMLPPPPPHKAVEDAALAEIEPLF